MAYLSKDEEFIREVYGLVYGIGYDKEWKAHDAVIKQLKYYIEVTVLSQTLADSIQTLQEEN